MKRRTLIVASGSAAAAAGIGYGRLALAQRHFRTPMQALGPYYPASPPAEQDNDLTRIAGANGIAKGELATVAGTVFDTRGKPLAGVRVEIWQCDANGRYHHPLDTSTQPIDPLFQGFGATTTDATGNYTFETIKPVPYPGRAPHIHFKLAGSGVTPLVTQLYIAGHPDNARDTLLTAVRDKRERDSLLALFVRKQRSEDWTARWDIVLDVS